MARPGHVPARNASVPSRIVVGNSDSSSQDAQRSVVWGRRGRLRGLGLAGVASAMLLVSTAPNAIGTPVGDAGGPSRVIVISHTKAKPGDKVNAHHGNVVADLDIVNGVAADVSAADLADLRRPRPAGHP